MDALVAAWRAGSGAVAETAKRDPAKLLLPPELEKRCKAVELKIKNAERAAGGNFEQTKVHSAAVCQYMGEPACRHVAAVPQAPCERLHGEAKKLRQHICMHICCSPCAVGVDIQRWQHGVGHLVSAKSFSYCSVEMETPLCVGEKEFSDRVYESQSRNPCNAPSWTPRGSISSWRAGSARWPKWSAHKGIQVLTPNPHPAGRRAGIDRWSTWSAQ